MMLQRVILRDKSDRQWIYLKEQEGERGFPILIGTPEALEIHRVATASATERPLTHALTHGVIEAMGGELERVDIVDLRNNTFYAQLVLRNPAGDMAMVDARPSDALALGLRAGCPIRVAESVLEQVRTDKQTGDPLPDSPPESLTSEMPEMPEEPEEPNEPQTPPDPGPPTE
ncbi:MAG: bifunctional DNase/RNase [Planctomycetota bacterium]|jgi:bifunctional DNase/RNase